MTNLKIFLSLVLFMAASKVWAQEFYRYKNADGQIMMDGMIPAEYVSGGYDVRRKLTAVRL